MNLESEYKGNRYTTVQKEGVSQPLEERREKVVVKQYGAGIVNRPETQYIQSSETITTNMGSDYGKTQTVTNNRFQSPARIYRKE